MNRHPPMRHRATLERNAETELDANRQPKPPSFELLNDALPCTLWETPERPRVGVGTAGLHQGPDTDIVVEGLRMLVRRDADIRIGDVVTEIRELTGAVISSDRMAVVQDLWRRSHRDLGLEAVKATAGVA